MGLSREKPSFIGIDSDGCVFDSMTVKQAQCFHSTFLDLYDLWSIETPARFCLEFVNLFSATRGQDRFVCFDLAVDLMHKHPEIGADVALPDTTHLKAWLATSGPYGNVGLQKAIDGEILPGLTGSAELAKLMQWSLEVDVRVKQLDIIPAFPNAVTFLEKAKLEADLLVVSSTPVAALSHEWESNGIIEHIRFIASKDIGKKTQHLQWATDGKGYERRLMIGDAPKDMESAQEVGVRFYPINPGKEDASWKRLHEEVLGKFLADDYSEALEQQLIEEFLALLPENPEW